MPKKNLGAAAKPSVEWMSGEPNPKQLEFFRSTCLYTAYGGAKGGGKTWAVRTKAIGGCLVNPGIRILIMRCHYPELEENHINPIKSIVLPLGLASYNGTTHLMTFENGSTIKFGHWNGDESENEYNGLEYDWIFIDEATQFSERAFNFLGGCLRGATAYPKRMYLTCNPGGVGHRWVKRLFIDRQYKTNCKNPEENEDPRDYKFIFATVEDNTELLKNSPTYLKTLANMPEDLRDAYRYGNWDAIGGNYFKNFSAQTHTMKPFRIPDHWQRYRSFDYGLDMFACCWWAVDEDGRAWCYREYEHKDLIISEAAQKAVSHTLPSEHIQITYAPPDMWNRQKDTGRSMSEMFSKSGLPIVKADNNRVQGHMMMKEAMQDIPLKDPYVRHLLGDDKAPAAMPALMFFSTLTKVVSDINDIQADDVNPNDCAKTPHEITHSVDAVRYFCISRTLAAEEQKTEEYEEEDAGTDYETYMTGGEPSASYIGA